MKCSTGTTEVGGNRVRMEPEDRDPTLGGGHRKTAWGASVQEAKLVGPALPTGVTSSQPHVPSFTEAG